LPKVTCYGSLLNQVFMNLLSNAIDALENQPPPRKITIRTEVGTEEWVRRRQGEIGARVQQNPFVVIRITDNGCGMNENIQKQIFDPFFTTKAVGSGRGLGLAICYQLVVEKHQGQIRCVSTPGVGTEFIVEIPVTQEYLLSEVEEGRRHRRA
jgi:signal transduction histidine kinase